MCLNDVQTMPLISELVVRQVTKACTSRTQIIDDLRGSSVAGHLNSVVLSGVEVAALNSEGRSS